MNAPLSLFALAVIIMTPFAVLAEEVRYTPDNCAFQVIFPGEPSRGQRCDPEDVSQCTPVTSYTKIIDNDATITVTVTCVPITPEIYESYNSAVMQATLAGGARREYLDEKEVYFHQHDTARQAILIGAGISGATPMIYTTQLWAAPTSLLTAEARLIGESPSPETHEIFAQILRSIGVKQESPANPEQAEDEEDDNNDSEQSDD